MPKKKPILQTHPQKIVAFQERSRRVTQSFFIREVQVEQAINQSTLIRYVQSDTPQVTMSTMYEHSDSVSDFILSLTLAISQLPDS